MVTVSVLGPVRAEVEGRPVELGGRRQRAVLARLTAAEGHVVSAERIIDDLWAGEPPPKALAALQVYVSHLRRALEPGRASRTPADVLVSVAPGYALKLPFGAVDAWTFPDLVRRAGDADEPEAALALLDEALASWSGPAYAECADAGWAAPVAARLEELRLVAIEQRALHQLALGLATQVVPALERHVHDHPLREDAVRLLALALYRTGRQADALAALRRARSRLHDELGVDPGAALRVMEADVLAHAPTLDIAAPTARSLRLVAVRDAPVEGPVLRGRAGDLERLHAAAAAARKGARAVWLGGEAGTGKTTLARALCASLAEQGWRVAWGRCPEVEGAPPAWAWTEALAGVVQQAPPSAAVAERLQAVGTHGAIQPADLFRGLRAASEYVGELTAQGPLCIVLDDVHRADDRTLQVVRQALAEHAEQPLLVVATHRSSEAPPELEVTRAALAASTADRVELAGLDRQGVGELFADVGLPDLDDALVRTLTERTSGNPLFVLEVARLLIAQGADAAEFSVPPGVRDVLRQRVARLPGQAQDVLRLAAVVGRDVAVDVVLAASDAGEDTVLDGLEAGVVAGLLVEPAPGQLRFAHALVRDALYEDLSRLRRTRLHARVLDSLREVAPHDVAALAHHAIASLTPATAVAVAGDVEAAARQAEAVTAYGEAARLWQHAIAATELAAPDAARLAELLALSVSATASAGDTNGARSARQRALALAASVGDDELVTTVLTSWQSSPIIWTSLEMCLVDAPFVEVLRAALVRETRPRVRCELLCELAQELQFEDTGEALAASASALATARDLGDDRLLCRALNARYCATTSRSQSSELVAIGDELLEVATGRGDTGYQTLAHYVLMRAAQDRGDVPAATFHADAAVALAAGGQLAMLLAGVAVWSAVCALVEGRLEEAAAIYRRAAGDIRDAGGANADGMLVMGEFTVGYARGDTSPSLDGLVLMQEMAPGAFSDQVVLALLDAGRTEEARLAWQPGLDIPLDSCWQWATALHGDIAARIGDAATARRCYDDLLPHADAWAGMSTAALVFAPVALTLGELAMSLGDQAAADRHFAHSLRMCHAMGAERWAARTRTAAAKLAAAV